MERRLASYIGCLLGLAAGDAMGYPVDHKPLEAIRAEYGPEGICECDLENGFAPTTSHTQSAAYGCNGLLLGLTRGQLSGTMAPPVSYIAIALREWAALQLWRMGEGSLRVCWVSRTERMNYRRCMDTGMLDILERGDLGTMEEPRGSLSGPGGLMAAVPVGLFFDPGRLGRREIQRLGAEAAALTHGDPAAFLSGAALAHMVSRITWDGVTDLKALTKETKAMLKKRFGKEYHQAALVSRKLLMALALADMPNMTREEALEQLGCKTADQVLAGAVYCCLTNPRDFSACMRAAVNHSGASAAVGAVAGAILGAVLGEEGIPAGDLERLECGSVLRELAQDMFQGCPMMMGSRVFDVEWDAKYVTPGV